VAGTVAGRELATRRDVTLARGALRFPRPAVAAPPLPAGSDLHIPGLSSFITPNNTFYRVDTALLLPQVDPSTWQLRIHGMVQREVTITFAELLRRPLIEAYVTLTCVSDPVGGPYVGNAKWLGARLADLIRQARPRAGASQLLCTSVDGFTSGTPLQVVLDGRDALLAVAMNGTALPVEHGFPARMVVPGLYGYVSATKWVTDIEVTTFADATAYWATRGWSQQAPIKTESRIDVPADRLDAASGADAGGRGGMGPAQGRRRRRGPGRPRRVARGAAGRGPRHRHLAAVGVPVAGHPGRPRDRRPAPPTRPGTPRPRCRPSPPRTAPPATPPPPSPSAALKEGAMSEADAEFARLARSIWTTGPNGTRMPPPGLVTTGSTRGCPTQSAQARADERRALDGWAARLAALDRGALSAEHQVDAAMMADGIARRVFEIDELREHTWNPLLANPGKAIYQLLARDFAPLPDRLGSVAGGWRRFRECWPRPGGSSGGCPGCTWKPRSGSSTARSRWSATR
jgi:DMSO/TMAO reductase YedYZ molybdopterin-dependent catalytic subunit